jgi:hypothetical protein
MVFEINDSLSQIMDKAAKYLYDPTLLLGRLPLWLPHPFLGPIVAQEFLKCMRLNYNQSFDQPPLSEDPFPDITYDQFRAAVRESLGAPRMAAVFKFLNMDHAQSVKELIDIANHIVVRCGAQNDFTFVDGVNVELCEYYHLVRKVMPLHCHRNQYFYKCVPIVACNVEGSFGEQKRASRENETDVTRENKYKFKHTVNANRQALKDDANVKRREDGKKEVRTFHRNKRQLYAQCLGVVAEGKELHRQKLKMPRNKDLPQKKRIQRSSHLTATGAEAEANAKNSKKEGKRITCFQLREFSFSFDDCFKSKATKLPSFKQTNQLVSFLTIKKKKKIGVARQLVVLWGLAATLNDAGNTPAESVYNDEGIGINVSCHVCTVAVVIYPLFA